ncbi:MAG: Na+/H+ antiporter subunit E [Acidimicrobiia bacterium]|nr:Na+/H+ antiporter subunit E [Acidimicrobiia bacterium]
MNPLQLLGGTLIALGTALSVLAAWGVLNFPSALSRMHAATKSASLGLALIGIGAGIAAGSWGLVGIGVLVTTFLFITAPISGHLVGRATYLAGRVTDLQHDDLADCVPSPLRIEAADTARKSPLRFIALVAVWVLLWRDLSIGVLLGGVLVALITEFAGRVPQRTYTFSASGLSLFLVRYIWLVVQSNLRVAWEVATPSNEQISEGIVAVPLETRSTAVALLVANAISYTPGTLTIELTGDPLVLYVHVLHFESVEQVRADVAKLERLAMRALPEFTGV